MQTFEYVRPGTAGRASASWRDGDAFIAGGTDLLQLMKSNVVAPRRVIDLAKLDLHQISASESGLELGALCTMSQVAEDEDVRNGWPAISQALLLSASPQVRNMGTVGGNLLQRPRCWYFRNPDVNCLKKGGDRCYAVGGLNRYHAIFGGGPSFIVHPSNLAPAMIAHGARLTLESLTNFWCVS